MCFFLLFFLVKQKNQQSKQTRSRWNRASVFSEPREQKRVTVIFLTPGGKISMNAVGWCPEVWVNHQCPPNTKRLSCVTDTVPQPLLTFSSRDGFHLACVRLLRLYFVVFSSDEANYSSADHKQQWRNVIWLDATWDKFICLSSSSLSDTRLRDCVNRDEAEMFRQACGRVYLLIIPQGYGTLRSVMPNQSF